MNRGAPIRIQAYNHFASLGCNVVAIDYRGFGDSHGTPTEQGLLRDARSAYKWIIQRRRAAANLVGLATDSPDLSANILVSGQSLGTGVASRLALDLVDIGHPPEAVLLLAPYTSIRNLITSYRLGGIFPIFWPLSLSKSLLDLANRYLYTHFESDKALSTVVCGGRANLTEEQKRHSHLNYLLSTQELAEDLELQPRACTAVPTIVIAHADNDLIIPHSHGQALFDTVRQARYDDEQEPVKVNVEHFSWGTLHSARLTASRELILVKSRKGGHNGLPKHAIELFASIVTKNGNVSS